MKKFGTFCNLFLFFSIIANSSAWAGTVTVASGSTYQTISGFGAASVWVESKITSALANIFYTDDSSQPPASQVNGNVGLSILRIEIDDSGNANWGTACNSAKQALAINPNMRIFASPWSPPAKWKNNNQTAGNNTGSDNGNPGSSTNQLNTADYANYAAYITSFATACKNTYGFTPYAISVQNEPDYDPSYDACLWSASAFDTFIGTNLGPDLQAAGFTNIIMMPESFADNLNLAATTMGDSNAAKYVKVIGNHLYGGGPNTVPASYSTTAGHTVESWETEFSEKTSDGNIDSGLYYSNSLHNCLVDHNFNAWCYWWLVNDNTDDEGLCDSSGNPTKRLYCLGNYSKFVRPGYVRIGATEAPSAGVSVSAYYSASAGKVVIVAINNNSSTQSQTFNYSDLNVSTVYPWITDSTRNLVQQTSVAVSGGSFTYTLPAQSVVSFVAAVSGGVTPTLTFTPTFSNSPTKTFTGTPTNTFTPTNSSTKTFTPVNTSTFTFTSTSTNTASSTNTKTSTPVNTPTFTSTNTPTNTYTRTFTQVNTPTPTFTSTNTFTQVNTATSSWTPVWTNTATKTSTPTAVFTNTFTQVNTATDTWTPLFTNTPTFTLVNTATYTWTGTSTATKTFTPVNTPTSTATSTWTAVWTNTSTFTSVNTATSTNTPIFSNTPSNTPTVTLSPTPTFTFTPVWTATDTRTPTNTFSPTWTHTSTLTSTPTATLTDSFTPTATFSPTPTFTATDSMTATSTATDTSTATGTYTSTKTFTPTFTWTFTHTFTPTDTFTHTNTPTQTFTPTQTYTPTSTYTQAPTPVTGHIGIYPNPAPAETVYILPPYYSGVSNVRIEIFTLGFRKVIDLTMDSVPTGMAITVRLVNRFGNPLANGLYYVVVTTRNGRTTGKLLVIK